MENAVEVKKQAEVALYAGMMDDAPVAASDLVMPVLLLMQPTSKLVGDEKAKAGQFVGSLEKNLVAEKGAPIELIPFGVHKTWVIFKKEKEKQIFDRIEPVTDKNASRPREETIDGTTYQNFETLNYFAVLTSDIAKGFYLPYLIRFRSTGYKTGKTMETFRAKLQQFGKPHCASTFLLSAEYTENLRGKFYVPQLAWGRDTSPEELAAIKPWLETVKAGKAKVDDSDLRTEEAPHADATVQDGPGVDV